MRSDLHQTVKIRRSIRRFLHQEVPKSILQRILESARWSPSAHNAQPWRFVVIIDSDLKRKLAESMSNEWLKDLRKDGVSSEDSKSLAESSVNRFVQTPVIIVASITLEKMDVYPDERRQRLEHLMATQSLAASIENLLLAAESEGLGACWFCAPLFCQDAVRKVLGMPLNAEPQALIALGYPGERPITPERRLMSEIVFKNRWGETF